MNTPMTLTQNSSKEYISDAVLYGQASALFRNCRGSFAQSNQIAQGKKNAHEAKSVLTVNVDNATKIDGGTL